MSMSTTAQPALTRVHSFGDLREVADSGAMTAIVSFLHTQSLETLRRFEDLVVETFTNLHEADSLNLVNTLLSANTEGTAYEQFWLDVWLTSTVNRTLGVPSL